MYGHGKSTYSLVIVIVHSCYCVVFVYIVNPVEYFLSRYCNSYFPVLWFLWCSSHLLSYSSDLQIGPLWSFLEWFQIEFFSVCHCSLIMYIFSSLLSYQSKHTVITFQWNWNKWGLCLLINGYGLVFWPYGLKIRVGVVWRTQSLAYSKELSKILIRHFKHHV